MDGEIAFDHNGPITGAIAHKPDTAEILLREGGVYSAWFQIHAFEPNQISLFLNGSPIKSTYGIDNCKSLNAGMVIFEAKAGDVLTLRNYRSYSQINLQEMEGGRQQSVNASVIVQRINKACRHNRGE
ncbi:MAG: hypothetical protein FWH06_03500 [Oscillospiraceae bacterium]|nr:hypothetical protein [Oscillospiraceae bacterium]